MTTTSYTIRIDQDLRERAFAVLDRYGLSPAQAFKLFLKQIADTQSIPLTFDHHAERVPNAVTLRALKEAVAERENPTAKRYTLEEAIQAMQEIAGG